MVSPNIRNLEEADLPAILNLKKAYELELGWKPPDGYFDEFLKILQGIRKGDPGLIKVAVVKDKIVGYCISVSNLHCYDGVVLDITMDSAYIWELFVLREYRGKGIGRRILEETLKHLESIGKRNVFLIVNYWNDRGRKFFEKMGFRFWGYFLIKRLVQNE